MESTITFYVLCLTSPL